MKAHLKQADVDIGRTTADDLHGNGQADILANEGTAAHGDLDPEGAWTRWAVFANKVFHFWRLVGPSLRERPDDEPRVKLPRQPAAEEPEVPVRGMVYPEAPFITGFTLAEARSTDPATATPQGEALGIVVAADDGRVFGYQHMPRGATGSTDAP
eukprot:6481773-Amphidinium_carterae.1